VRLWSLHPKYLDPKGLVALWREGLLAKKVLENKTKGYRNHPQLDRFKKSTDSIRLINLYLHLVCDEADQRGYKFNRRKLSKRSPTKKYMNVKSGQILYEFDHLLKKMKSRCPERFVLYKKESKIETHPIFKRVPGKIEPWEKI
jgi:hypothetical protein